MEHNRHDVLLSQQFLQLPYVRSLASFSSFSKECPRARARETSARDSCIHLDRFLIANNPDLNPVEYKVWGIMQQRSYQTKMQDVDNFRQCTIDGWIEMQQSVIDNATDQWRRRVYNIACGPDEDILNTHGNS